MRSRRRRELGCMRWRREFVTTYPVSSHIFKFQVYVAETVERRLTDTPATVCVYED